MRKLILYRPCVQVHFSFIMRRDAYTYNGDEDGDDAQGL